MMKILLWRWAAPILSAGVALSVCSADSLRERTSLDSGWKFYLGDTWGTGEKLDKAGVGAGPARVSFSDVFWRTVDLPHDWVVELPFDEASDRSHGYKPVGPGYGTNSVGWYRRRFDLAAEDRGKRVWLEFDGVYRDSRIFLNGYRIAHHESGYGSFRCDVTDVANFGRENILVVRVDASKPEGWFYEGAGIYRHVWLEKTAPFAVAPDGTFVYTEFKNNNVAGTVTARIETDLENSQNRAVEAKIEWEMAGPDGKAVATATASMHIAPWKHSTLMANAPVPDPILWSPESPRLYHLVTTIEADGQTVDRVETKFGIRTIAFDVNKGFMLNGRPYVIKGTCNHQDHAGVGVALPDALQNFRVAELKEMGCNAIRTSHNAPTPELLEACDRLGMLVMDENRLLGSDAENLSELAAQVRRDRNHPSVFIWSLANEEEVQRTTAAGEVFGTMQRLVHDLDPTRLCTAAMNSWSGDKPDGFSTVMDVQGFNYLNNGDMDAFHRSNPEKPAIGTEEASAFYTRGVYSNTVTYDSAYDDNKPGYGATAEEWWKYYSARPWASGAFVWTGFDYRGEPSPFGWPNISSEFGIIDTCGFPKDVFYYYQSWWSDKTVLHLMPHWNWTGKEGQPIDVRCFGNCQEVELFLNGRSLGRKVMEKNSHLQWSVNYAPGALVAKGYKDGKVIAEDKVETTGEPAGLRLTPDRQIIAADAADVSVVTVAVTDSAGRIVPVADNMVNFEISGPGKIIGVGNGDPACHEPDVYPFAPQAVSQPLTEWRMKLISDPQNRAEIAAEVADGDWHTADVRADSGPLKPGELAIYRTHLSLSEKDLKAANTILNFGTIDDEGWVYVNGRLAGESHDWQLDPIFPVSQYLKAGDNVVAVVVKNNEGSGGLSHGVTLNTQYVPAMTPWKRSAFNGLAKVLVQSTHGAGEIKLTAHAGGLTDGALTIRAQVKGD